MDATSRRSSLVLPLIALVAAAGCADARQQAAPRQAHAAAARKDLGVVTLTARIGGDTERSAGAVLDPAKGLVLTTAHGVWGATSLQVATGLAVLHGRIVARDACDDLALVEIQPRIPGLAALAPTADDSVLANAPLVSVRRRDAPAGAAGPALLTAPATVRSTSAELLPGVRPAGALRLATSLAEEGSGAPLIGADGRLAGLAMIARPGGRTSAAAVPWTTIRARLDELRPGPSTIYVGWRRHYRCASALHRYTRARHPGFRTGDARLEGPVPVTRLPGTKGLDGG